MKAFEPIYIGEYHRFVAICKDEFCFVADAHVSDRDNKDRATVTHMGKLDDISSIWDIVNMLGENKWSYVKKDRSSWMEETDKIDLIMLYKVYRHTAFAYCIE